MKTIIDYVKEFGKYTFDIKPFNEIDNLVLSTLGYLDFDSILVYKNKKNMTIGKAGVVFFHKYNKKELKNNIMSVQSAIKLFEDVYKSRRFKDLPIYNYIYKGDEKKQFGALFIDINEELTYVTFEGTDDLISGWYEDAKLSYEFPIPAHVEAIKYINQHVNPFNKRKYILGGHSKGGNIALVAGMYVNPMIKNKIINIYMNDAPGLKLKQIKSRRYKNIEDKIIKIIPDQSVVGLMLRHTGNFIVVKSNKKGLFAHDMTTWGIEGKKFVRGELSTFSKKVDRSITKWLDTFNDEEREQFINDLFDVLNRAGIDSLLDIKASILPSVISILKESKKLDSKTSQAIKSLLALLIEEAKDVPAKFIKEKIYK